MNVLTLTELQNHILFRARIKSNQLDPSNNSTTGLKNLTQVINAWKDKIVQSNAFSWRQGLVDIATNGQFSHDLPANVQRIASAYDKANERSIFFKNISDIRLADPGLVTTGDPRYFTYPGTALEKRQIGFWPIGSITVQLEYDKQFKDLEETSETLESIGIPASVLGSFHKALFEGVLVDIMDYLNQGDRSIASISKFRDYVEDLKDLDGGHLHNTETLMPQGAYFRREEVGRWPSNYPKT